jgi:hypothetical protein
MKIWEPFEDGYTCENLGLFSFNYAWWVHKKVTENGEVTYEIVIPRLFVAYAASPETNHFPQKSEALETAKRIAEAHMKQL